MNNPRPERQSVVGQVPASLERPLAALILGLDIVYLLRFVRRGWVAHDEGLLGQTAERVLRGQVPHVDYQEPYTGALTFLYAAVFRVAGVDLANIRWLVFAGAVVAIVLTYLIVRRYLRPIGSAVATSIAVTWSFPNYFSGLPSWWGVICALAAVWALFRFVETRRWEFALLAGLAVGVAIIIKQTGAYLVPPLIMSLIGTEAGGRSNAAAPRLRWFLIGAVAVGSIGFSITMLRARLDAPEITYLLLPIVATAAGLVARIRRSSESLRWTPAAVALGGAVLPGLVLLIPYVLGGQVQEFITGAFVLPQRRISFTNLAMLPAPLIVFGPWMIACMLPIPQSLTQRERRILHSIRWTMAFLLPIAATRSLIAYHAIWQSARAIGALIPLAVLWLLARKRLEHDDQRERIFIVGSMLAWASLAQYPFSAPIYFCYVVPLAVVAGTAVLTEANWIGRPGVPAWAALLLMFAGLSLNRGDVTVTGLRHEPRTFPAPLALSRAGLLVVPQDAHKYQRVVSLVVQHLGSSQLLAGPDCPEIYFLSGTMNPAGVLYDFFSQGTEAGTFDRARWPAADVVVINHSPIFSARLSPDAIVEIRSVFAQGEQVGEFEVRWR